MQPSALAAMIDHTLLKPDATAKQIEQLCCEARRYDFAAVCVNPIYVALASRLLGGSGVKVCAVVGFPLGATTSEVKAFEAKEAIRQGALEIDMVLNLGALKSGEKDVVLRDIEQVRAASAGKILKVIVETALLSREETIYACLAAQKAGADFVKTSTGFNGVGASVEDVKLMRETVGPRMGVKASGGIRDADVAAAMIAAGATRLGTSSSVAIVTHAAAGL
jgi:deoxyribose-phosphate aldolase